ncbi:unnamed protein product [Polarella glacialis]|uniref:C3H1-type domain-containing protein n=1 Tax=Polarella glacialis TaxID=89957 RepID=A0A813K475_POLGL|nr:unnamed protein product [Polarella glacialis]
MRRLHTFWQQHRLWQRGAHATRNSRARCLSPCHSGRKQFRPTNWMLTPVGNFGTTSVIPIPGSSSWRMTGQPSSSCSLIGIRKSRGSSSGYLGSACCHKPRKNVSAKGSGGNKESRFLAIMAEAHGMVDDIEIDSPTSHFRVTKALSLRATCWALVGWCHLKSAKSFASHVIEHFTKRPLEGSGLRSPTAPEAEAADQALVETLVSLMGHSNMTLDQAIYEVVDVRCMAATLLVPRPLAAKATNNNASHTRNNMPTADGGPVRTAPQPKATPYGQRGQSKKMPCHLFKKTGACKFGDQCKFKHTSGSGHGRATP